MNGPQTGPAPQSPEDQPPTTPDQLMAALGAMGIAYEMHRHRPIFTVAEGKDLKASIPGTHCRNLFLRDRKERMVLVVVANETMVDMKRLPDVLGCDRLSFGSAERLWRHLGVRPGSVCPFAIMNDRDRQVRIVIDDLIAKSDLVNFHPLQNDMSLVLSPKDLLTFIRSTGHEPEIMDLSAAAPDERDAS